MDHDTIVKTVNSIFVERFELDESELTPDKRIIEDLVNLARKGSGVSTQQVEYAISLERGGNESQDRRAHV